MKRSILITTILLALLIVATSVTAAEDPNERDALMALYNSTNGPGWTYNTSWGTADPHCTWSGVFCFENSVVELDLTGNKLSPPPYPEEDPNERDALMALYNSTNGPDWTYNTGWGTADPHCTWSGVSCFENSVVELDLTDNQLSGPIPPELGNLSNLVWLILSNNQLSGPVPAALINLSKLYELWLSNNPDLKCWQTEAALIWAQGLQQYEGPDAVCPFVCLPVLLSDGG